MKTVAALLLTSVLSLGTLSGEAAAQPVPVSTILIIDSERLFAESDFGKRVIAEQQADTAILAAEYRRIEAELSEEERELTKKRPDMTPEDFRKVADAFDARVEDIREIQQQREVDLVAKGDAGRQQFFQQLGPVLQNVLADSGAVLVLEKRTVFASSSTLDVTNRVLAQANAILGDGRADDSAVAPEEN